MSEPAAARWTRIVRAPAKLTLSLRITGRRADGHHLIDAEMVALDLHDVLTFTAGDMLTMAGPYAAGVATDETNLVRRALAAVGRQADVHVDKQIPAGGGLGGGSSDAAAVLRWAGCDDLALAARLGADVPFCLTGGRARVTGIGEVVEPLPTVDRTFTLVIPPLAVSTVAVYRAWDELGGPRSEGPNDLEPAALVVEPALATWRDRIREAAGGAPTLAGSGATWFLQGAIEGLAEALAPAVCVVTRTDRPG
jgi:4-diphosphocytidyl-2-C-methyl-D-erythritol kinase